LFQPAYCEEGVDTKCTKTKGKFRTGDRLQEGEEEEEEEDEKEEEEEEKMEEEKQKVQG
jgi:hypothetical protein